MHANYKPTGLTGISLVVIRDNSNSCKLDNTAESQLLVHSLLSGTEREVRVMDSRSSIGGKIFVPATHMCCQHAVALSVQLVLFLQAKPVKKGCTINRHPTVRVIDFRSTAKYLI